ncbi:FecCD family ABC transporter permease [Aeribacillus pallidus]|uniref:FecCD family ABC transporter permease n=1 Tax=Aeribacillus pallidus TaxID=33936 RepID=UPI003D23994B
MQKPFIQINLNKKIQTVLAIVIAIGCIALGVSAGALSIPFSIIGQIFLHKWLAVPLPDGVTDVMKNVIWNVRLPRVVLAFLVGASLSLAGAAFQGLLKNPLADPYTLGVSSGASVGAVLVIFFQWQFPIINGLTLPFVSIAFALLTLWLVLRFAKAIDHHLRVETLILTGIIFSSFLGAVITLFVALSGEELRQIITWLMGSVAMRGWEFVYLLLPFFLIGALLIFFNIRELNAFTFGEEVAKHLGVDTEQRKKMLLLGASILTGASVAVSGTIGFVGLVIPHMVRLFIGSNHRWLLPHSLFYGGAFLVIADLFSRTIIEPRELPIGVVTSFIGAPIFTFIFFRRRRKGM